MLDNLQCRCLYSQPSLALMFFSKGSWSLNLIGAIGSTSGGPIGLLPAQVHSYDRKLTLRLKEGFLYKALAGDSK
jgi:hypothetical protein